MWNPPTDAELQKLPPIGHYRDKSLADIKIHQHYFFGSADWWISEYDSKDKLFYGYACLGDKQLAEWGYIALDELMDLKISPVGMSSYFEVDRDLYWQPRYVPEVMDIVACYKEQGLERLLYKK